MKAATILVLSLCAFAPALAQQTPNQAGQTGQTGTTGSGATTNQAGQTNNPPSPGQESEAPPRAEITPLSGADIFAPGTAGGGHSYLLPSFEFTGYASTNQNGSTDRFGGDASVLGSLVLQDVRRQSQLNLEYAGGEYFYSKSTNTLGSSNGTFHRLGVSEGIVSGRWHLELLDQAMYLPESPFGFSGFGGLEGLGYGLGGGYLASGPLLNPSFGANQTILTGATRQLSNSTIAQVAYNPRARSAFTITGTYGLLHFLGNSGLIDSNYWTMAAGYNYAVTRRNLLAVMFTQSEFRFGASQASGLNQAPSVNHASITSRSVYLQYGRKLASRLFLELSGGPTFNRTPLLAGGTQTRSFWSTSDSLSYRLSDRESWQINYTRYITSGSGVLLGAESDLAGISLNRQMTRSLFGALDLGYARNRALTQQAGTNGGFKFDTWQAGLNLTEQFGPHTNLYFDYHLQRQVSDRPICFGSNCQTVYLRHVLGVGVNWHGRPMRLR